MKRITLMFCMAWFLGMFLLPGGAAAFNPADVERLKATSECPNCDLSGANLSEANLSGAYLGEANLDDAILSGTSWTDGTRCKEGSVGSCKK